MTNPLENLVTTPPARTEGGCTIISLLDQVHYITAANGGTVPTNLTKGNLLVYTRKGQVDVEFYFGGQRQDPERLGRERRLPFLEGTDYILLMTPGSSVVQVQLDSSDPLLRESSRDGNMGSVPPSHQDSHRIVVNITPRVKAFTVHGTQELRLGDHYHEVTPELFFVEEGRLQCKLEDTRNHLMEGSHRVAEYTVEVGQTITIPLHIAYSVVAEPGTRFLGILGSDFNLGDLRPYRIKW